MAASLDSSLSLLSVVVWLLPIIVSVILFVAKRRKQEEANQGGAGLSGTPEVLGALWEAAQKSPEEARAHLRLGRALLTMGRWSEAADAFRRAAALEPQNALAYLLLGTAQRRGQQRGEALAAFERCFERDPFGRHGRAARKRIDALSREMVRGGGAP